MERIGHSIECWDCRQNVPVPAPKMRNQSARVLSFGVREIFSPKTVIGIAAGAFVFTMALLMPVPEPMIAGLTLAALVFVYGEMVRRWGLSGSLGGVDSARRQDARVYSARAAATLAVALAMTNAWEFGRVWLGHSTGLFQEALAVSAALAVVFPLAMLIVWAAPHPRQSLSAVARHPVSTLLALMIVPAGLVAAEATAAAVTSLQGYFMYYVLDLLPGSVELAERFGIPLAGNYAVSSLPDERHVALYFHHLKHGMTLSMALPSSLLDPSTVFLRPWALETSERGYMMIRAFHTGLVAMVWFAALTVQARCLGLLARLWDWQRPRTQEFQAVVWAAGVEAEDEVVAIGDASSAERPALQSPGLEPVLITVGA